MMFKGEVTLLLSVCNKHNGITFPIPPFEAKENKSFTAIENAHQMALRSFQRRMRTEKNDKKELLYEGVKAEDIRVSVYEVREPKPEPVKVDILEGQGSLF